MGDYVFTQDFGFIRKGRVLIEQDDGDFFVSQSDEEFIAKTASWNSYVVLRKNYVESLVGTVLSPLLPPEFITEIKDELSLKTLIETEITRRRLLKETPGYIQEALDRLYSEFPRPVTIGTTIYAPDMKALFTVTENAENETVEYLKQGWSPRCIVTTTMEEFKALAVKYAEQQIADEIVNH